ncbi:MAG: FtsK/SpoIIIE domain-containing protein [Pirellulaceae bacterium]
MDSYPRPLSRQRLGQLIHGLQTRFSSSAQEMSREVQRLSEQLSQLEAARAQQLDDFEQQRRSDRESSTHEWDETLSARWDDAEMRSFKAVYDTASREGALRRQARQQAEQLTAELKKRIHEIDQSFLRAKEVPIGKLNRFRSRDQELFAQWEEIANAAQTSLDKNNLTPPEVDLSPATMMALETTPSSADAALEALQNALGEARAASGRLANYPLARFFNSPLWWLCMALVSIALVVLIGLAGWAPWLMAAVLGATMGVALLLLSMLGIRPWLKRFAAAEYPKVRQQLHLAQRYHTLGEQLAISENDAELKRLASKREERYGQAKQWRDQSAQELTNKLNCDIEKLLATAEVQKQLASQQLSDAIADSDREYTQRLHSEWQQSSAQRDALLASHEEQQQTLRTQIEQLQSGGAHRLQTATQKALQLVARSRQWADQLFPAWDHWQSTDNSHPSFAMDAPLLPLGSIGLEPILSQNATQNIDTTQLTAPLYFDPLRDGYLVITADPNAPEVQALLRELVTRALVGLPAGKTQVCVIDPPGLGRDFGWLMHLSDFDPQLVTHRVWTQPGHIAKQLTTLAMAAEDFIQQSLRNEYRDIAEYNLEAGPLAEPYRLLVWSALPSGLDDQSWKSLRSLLETGARCGIIPIMVIDPQLDWPQAEMREFIQRRGLHLVYHPQSEVSQDRGAATVGLFVDEEPLRPWRIVPPTPASEEQSHLIIQDVGRQALLSSHIEVPLERMLPAREQRWQADSSHALEIPIGQSGVGRMHALKLGVGTAQHAMIAGKTGSGKSSLLHAIITSAALKYSPERLRVVLLDFKKGVEFQVYSDAGLPHADIIGIESHREFGLSALEYIDACMQRRGEAFRQSSVQDIASWNARHPDKPLPRMVLLIDEFQELFVEEDKLASQASLILDRIVRQGRSFGIHAILSSQTLAGAYSLPRTTLGQMAVRIALQCDASDAQIIFADDNPAAARLKHPGQAVYNDAGGRIEGNQPMQIGWLTKEQQVGWLAELPSGYRNQDPTTNRLGHCVVYDGNRAATWDAASADLAIAHAKQTINAEALWCVTGESVAIHPAVTFPLTRQAGRNMLVVAGEDRLVAPVLSSIAASLVRSTGAQLQLVILQGAKPTDAWALKLPTLWRDFSCDLQIFDSRSTEACLKNMHELLLQRMAAADAALDDSTSSAIHPIDAAAPTAELSKPILFNIWQLGRLRELRRDDDFGMGGFGESEMKPDKRLEEILRDGPSYGVFTLIWGENYSTVARWLSRTALRELEIRLLMQMSGNDSTHLIESIAASRLGEQVMLVYDEATGQEQRFRPFDTQWIDAIVRWGAGPPIADNSSTSPA